VPSDDPARSGSSSGDKPVDGVDNTVTPRRTNPTSRAKTDQSPARSSGSADSVGGPAATGGTDGELRGSDLARAALHAAQAAAARTRGQTSKQNRGGGAGRGGTMARRRRRWSGAGADERDPQPLGRLAARIASDRGWAGRLAGGQVFGRWATLVGSDVAEHTRPVQLTDGELTVEADSTAWATQLRLLQRQLLSQIAAGVGHGVVKRLKVQGPSAPSWRHGPRHVPGRGPRDTYG
jgi:predicted nucleic acid-binding Zn ribbon protein